MFRRNFLRTGISISFALFFICPIYSDHIIGTELNYKLISSDPNNFSINLFINSIINCQLNSSPPQTNQNVYLYTQDSVSGEYEFHSILSLPLISTNTLSNIEYPCIDVPSEVCAINSYYSIELNLPISNKSYIFVNASCCWTEETVNILNPGSSGILVTKTITPYEQQISNNPIFTNFVNSLTICSGETTNYEIPLVDLDGDSFSLQLSEIFYDGIPAGIQNPPPNDVIQFLEIENFSFENPFGTGGTILINNQAQSVEFLVNQPGGYAIGFRVKEYRDGILIGELNLVFQMTVLNCLNQITADVVSDYIDEDGKNTIIVCNKDEFQVLNTSVPADIIDEHIWSIELNDTTHFYEDWLPVITFPNEGEFHGKLILNPNQNCSDTLNLKFLVNPNFEIDFEIDQIQCGDESVAISDLTISDVPIQSQFFIAINDTFFNANPQINFIDTGTYQIRYFISDIYGCQSELLKSFDYFPINSEIITNTDTTICSATIFYPNFNENDFDSWHFDNLASYTPIEINNSRYLTLYATKSGCTFFKNIFIDVIDCAAKIYLPNIFSPNNDGINDIFGPLGSDFEVITFQIFDRWGSIIFEATDNESYWDGKYKGKWLDDGVYIYSLEYRETILGNILSKHGSVTLVR